MINPSKMAMTTLELKKAFDHAYAVPPPRLDSKQMENLLAIRVDGDPYAIRVSQINGLASDRKVVAVPSRTPELLGVVGIRGGLVPVYSLAALVGHDGDVNGGRWLALCGTEEPIGLAFSDFEGYFKVPLIHVYPAGLNHAIHESVRDAVRTADVTRAIVNIPSIVETIRRRCESQVSEER